MNVAAPAYQPQMTDEGLDPAHGVQAVNEFGETQDVYVPGEIPLVRPTTTGINML